MVLISPRLAPHVSAPAKPLKPISSRDAEIYVLRAEEKRTIPLLVKEFISVEI